MSLAEQKYLFLGAGGMGMAPLASWMSQAGYSVFGYDDYLQERVRSVLVQNAVEVLDFVLPEMVGDFDVVVYSSALRADHPLLVAAADAGVEAIRRGELLARVAKTRRLIAVVGSHGKTTTSGMVAHAIRRLKLDVGYILGGLLNDGDQLPSHCGQSEWLVAEVDESDGTIDEFAPECTLVLNLDWDHSDQYARPEDLERAFQGLVTRTRSCVWVPEHMYAERRFQVAGDCELRVFADEVVGLEVNLHTSGFNQKNASAALAVVAYLQGSFAGADCLRGFAGMARRQTELYADARVRVIEDYAHHPTEVAALLAALKADAPDRRLVVVFQGHRYSRTRQFKDDFVDALSAADALYLLPIYAAHEAPVVGGSMDDFVGSFDAARLPKCLSLDVDGVLELAGDLGDGAYTVAFVGAGDLDQLAAVFVSLLRRQQAVDASFCDYVKSRVSDACVLKLGEALGKKTTLRVGGAARFYAEPANFCDLRALLRAASIFKLSVFCLGRGSNLVVPEAGFDGLVIRFSGRGWRAIRDLGNGRIWAGAGVRLKELSGFAAKAGLSGFEFMEGIPGAVGGSLRMNAGAMGSWMFDVVERVQMLDEDGLYRDLPQSAFHFGYRKVEEIAAGIALGAIFKSSEVQASQEIRERIDSYSSSRKASQPREPSAGCVFKNPEGNYAGRLIDEHGIKGMAVGDAEVSGVHGNFIVNKGHASAGEVIELVAKVRRAVFERSGYVLEPEVLLVGQSWDSVLDSECGKLQDVD